MKKTFLEWLKNSNKKYMTQQEWIVSGDTGVSSKTMWSALNGVDVIHRADIPHDPADLGRCIRYMEKTNLDVHDLKHVKKAYPFWAPYVNNWDKLVQMYQYELATGHRAPRTYEYMKQLKKESDAIGRASYYHTS